MSSIEFIYFDLGNVILNFDHSVAFRNAASVAGVTPEKVEDVLVREGLQIATRPAWLIVRSSTKNFAC